MQRALGPQPVGCNVAHTTRRTKSSWPMARSRRTTCQAASTLSNGESEAVSVVVSWSVGCRVTWHQLVLLRRLCLPKPLEIPSLDRVFWTLSPRWRRSSRLSTQLHTPAQQPAQRTCTALIGSRGVDRGISCKPVVALPPASNGWAASRPVAGFPPDRASLARLRRPQALHRRPTAPQPPALLRCRQWWRPPRKLRAKSSNNHRHRHRRSSRNSNERDPAAPARPAPRPPPHPPLRTAMARGLMHGSSSSFSTHPSSADSPPQTHR
jgi:hypothetical protein